MRLDAPNGLLFDHLDPAIQAKTLYETVTHCYMALTSTTTNLITYPGVEEALRDASIFTPGGFNFLNNLIAMTGHPQYNAGAPDVPIP